MKINLVAYKKMSLSSVRNEIYKIEMKSTLKSLSRNIYAWSRQLCPVPYSLSDIALLDRLSRLLGKQLLKNSPR